MFATIPLQLATMVQLAAVGVDLPRIVSSDDFKVRTLRAAPPSGHAGCAFQRSLNRYMHWIVRLVSALSVWLVYCVLSHMAHCPAVLKFNE